MSWPVHPREAERQRALLDYEILDSTAEQAYDDLVELAATLFQVPTALVVFIDERRQWFKARRGYPSCETPREHAFCAHAILSDEVMVVPDALDDPRFQENPLVVGPPGIRFYAGAPLRSPQGLALGTLCIIDEVPRGLDEAGQALLERLARQVMASLELRRTAADLARALKREEQLRELLPICAYCKNIRDDEGYWQRVESYLHTVTGADLSHGICPSCFEQRFSEEPEAQGEPEP